MLRGYMTPDLEQPLAHLRRDGPRRFARWDGALFDSVAAGPATALRDALGDQPDAGPVLTAYLRMAQEAVGTSALLRAAADGPWTGFLERCLIELVPALLPREKAGRRLPLLARVWNLAEGLWREPSWLDRYVTACAGRLTDLADVEGFLVRTLDPVLAPAAPAAWAGPFAVTVLDLRPVQDEFLPGEVALAGPTLLRVDDRRRPGVQAGVLLRRGGRSELLGLTDGLAGYDESGTAPAVEFHDGRALVAGRDVELPALRRCHRHAVARAGFLAVCAVDSQRLWIVESP
jgi:hypothetical protein